MGSPRALPPDPHRLPDPAEWFGADAERHLLDRPAYCPMCAAALDLGIVTEFWSADERVFLTWCAACHWTGHVVQFERATIYEPEH
jgi:hypothetical protein